ncbi:14976_t:CDS:2 [Gigaspora rosea]|nr:14976_t:CDS:2 [Gigaspora rosea]
MCSIKGEPFEPFNAASKVEIEKFWETILLLDDNISYENCTAEAIRQKESEVDDDAENIVSSNEEANEEANKEANDEANDEANEENMNRENELDKSESGSSEEEEPGEYVEEFSKSAEESDENVGYTSMGYFVMGIL